MVGQILRGSVQSTACREAGGGAPRKQMALGLDSRLRLPVGPTQDSGTIRLDVKVVASYCSTGVHTSFCWAPAAPAKAEEVLTGGEGWQ